MFAKLLLRSVALALLCSGAIARSATSAAEEPPKEWIEPDTGHRVVRLSQEPGSASLYFHQYPYSADGRKLVMTTPGGISTVDLQTREIELVVTGRTGILVTGRKTGDIYYTRNGAIFATGLDSHATREIAKIPEGMGRGNITVNADETLIVGIGAERDKQARARELPHDRPAAGLERRWMAGTPLALYVIDVKTGESKVIHRSNDWLNHLQCSPTDPRQIMFCHEGPWHYVDRIWTIATDGSDLRLIHKRQMEMEIAGHEFFSADGKTIWYDLQTPKSGVFWLAGLHLETGERTWYEVERSAWSVHYNISPDGKLFAGDGGGPNSVASRTATGERLSPPGNGQWIHLFRPQLVRNQAAFADGPRDLIKTGVLKADRLASLANHDYDLEPNVTFTPDMKWIVFRSNMHGASHVYAVEVQKAN